MTEIPENLRKRAEAARARAEDDQVAQQSHGSGSGDQPPQDSAFTQNEGPPINLRRCIHVPWKPVLAVLAIMATPWLLLGLLLAASLPFHISFSFGVRRWLGRNFYPGNALFWWLLGLELACLGVTMASKAVSQQAHYRRWGRPTLPISLWHRVFIVAVNVLAAAVLVGGVGTSWWNNKDYPRFYNSATVFKVADINNPPQNLRVLIDGAHTDPTGRCDLIGKHDVPSCIQQGSLPAGGFYGRSMSYDGAMAYMAQSSGTGNNSNLLPETGVYLDAADGRSGVWSAVRDGSGIDSHLEGVVQWDGTPGTLPQICRFTGNYSLHKALRGGRSNSLSNLVREKYSPRFFRIEDTYGQCLQHQSGDPEPVLYIPLIVEHRSGHRTVEAPAGLLEVHGTSSGAVHFVYHQSVVSGEGVPGPVYPLSIAQTQRREHTWAAGRENQKRGHFGFEPTTAKEQAANPTDFLLRAKWDGRLYWVSQMTPRGNNSQKITAWFVVPADTVRSGQLNQLTIYAQNDGDPKAVNLELLINQVKQAISGAKVGFFTSGGVLTEFTPTAEGEWVGYGLYENLPAFKVTVRASDIRPVFVDYVSTSGPGEVPSSTSCQKPLADLTKAEMAQCIAAFAAAMANK